MTALRVASETRLSCCRADFSRNWIVPAGVLRSASLTLRFSRVSPLGLSQPSPDPALLVELLDYRMPFGKHKGVRLLELPEPYLAWFARTGMPAGKLGLLLETALVVRQNGLVPLCRELKDRLRSG